MADKWEQSRKNALIRIAAGFAFLLIVAGVLIRNNTDLLSFSPSRSSADSAGASRTKVTAVLPHDSGAGKGQRRDSDNIPSVPHVDRIRAEDYFTVPLRDIRCSVLDREDLTLSVSLNVHFHNLRQRDVILLRREDLKVAVQKVVAGKMLADINVDALRDDLIEEMNLLLGSKSVSGLEFLDLRPLK
jgi:hypothetical protein